LTAGPDLDFRALPDIARDRSPGGRVRLFAFLANLLVARWDRLSSGERTQLAELVAVLWTRGARLDQQQLATHFAGRTDIPLALQALIGLPACPPETVPGAMTVLPASTHTAAVLGAASSPESRPKKKVTITVTGHPIVIRHKRMAPPPAIPTPAPATGASAPAQAMEQTSALGEMAEQTGAKDASTLVRAAPDRVTAGPVPENAVPQLLAPRDNPHAAHVARQRRRSLCHSRAQHRHG